MRLAAVLLRYRTECSWQYNFQYSSPYVGNIYRKEIFQIYCERYVKYSMCVCVVATSGTVRNFRPLVSIIRASHEADSLLHPM
jgi:hypothetical protein